MQKNDPRHRAGQVSSFIISRINLSSNYPFQIINPVCTDEIKKKSVIKIVFSVIYMDLENRSTGFLLVYPFITKDERKTERKSGVVRVRDWLLRFAFTCL